MGKAESAGTLCHGNEKPEGPAPSANPAVHVRVCYVCAWGAGGDRSTKWAVLGFWPFCPLEGSSSQALCLFRVYVGPQVSSSQHSGSL